MQLRKPLSVKSAQQGVVLLEALIAILIFSFAILGIIGLQAAMVKNTAESKYRGEASYLANQTIGLMWTNPQLIEPNVASSVVQNTFSSPTNALGLLPNIGNLLPNGVSIVQPLGQPVGTTLATVGYQYAITVSWQAPGEQQPHSVTTLASIGGN